MFHVTAMTHRRDPIYPTTMVGRPPTEDFFMGKAAERIMLPALQMALPEVNDINMPAEGIFHNLVIVSIKKEYPGHARKVMHALWGIGLMMLAKTIVVLDHYVDVQDLSEGRVEGDKQHQPGDGHRIRRRSAGRSRSRGADAEVREQDGNRRNGEGRGRGSVERVAAGHRDGRCDQTAGRRQVEGVRVLTSDVQARPSLAQSAAVHGRDQVP